MSGIDETVSITKALEVLNRALNADPGAMDALMCARVNCNAELADDPTIQVTQLHQFGVLGLLNGIFGADVEGWGTIAGIWSVDCQNGHKVLEQLVGETCDECGSTLVQGALLRFEDLGRR